MKTKRTSCVGEALIAVVSAQAKLRITTRREPGVELDHEASGQLLREPAGAAFAGRSPQLLKLGTVCRTPSDTPRQRGTAKGRGFVASRLG